MFVVLVLILPSFHPPSLPPPPPSPPPSLPVFTNLNSRLGFVSAVWEPSIFPKLLRVDSGPEGLFMAALTVFLQESGGNDRKSAPGGSSGGRSGGARGWASSIKELQCVSKTTCKDCRKLLRFRLRVFEKRRVCSAHSSYGPAGFGFFPGKQSNGLQVGKQKVCFCIRK